MANAQGFSESVRLGPEYALKLPPNTPLAFKIPVINPSFKPTVTRFKSEALSGSAQPRVPVDGKVELQGSFDLECNDTSLAYPLLGLMGADPATLAGGANGQIVQGTTGNYDHIFNLQPLGSWFVEQRFADITESMVFKGCRINKGSFTLDPEGLMKATFNVMGCSTVVQGGEFVNSGGANLTDKTLDSPFSYLFATLAYNGGASTLFQNVKIDIDRQAEGVKTIDGTNALADIISKIAVVGGSFKLLFDDAVILNDALASNEVSLRIFVPGPTIGTGLRITVPTLKMMPSGPTTNGPGGLVTQEFTFDAYGASDTSVIAAFVGTKGFTSYTASTDNVDLTIDGNVVNIPITNGSYTPATLAAFIQAASGFSTYGKAYVENGRVIVESLTKGSTSTVKVNTSTSATFSNTLAVIENVTYTGFNNQAVSIVLTNADAQYVIPTTA